MDQTGLNNFDKDITSGIAGESFVPPEIQKKIDEHKDQFENFNFGTKDDKKKEELKKVDEDVDMEND